MQKVFTNILIGIIMTGIVSIALMVLAFIGLGLLHLIGILMTLLF